MYKHFLFFFVFVFRTTVTTSAHIKQLTVDASGRYAFVVCEMSRFGGQRLPAERHFVKQVCSLIDVSNSSQHRLVDKYSYIVRAQSRFHIAAAFVTNVHDSRRPNNVYLLTRVTTDALHDFDPECERALDWSEFETSVRVYGPIIPSDVDQHLPLHDEFKMLGEPLSPELGLSADHTHLVTLMQECHKLRDKDKPSVVKAKRYAIRINIYELFPLCPTSASLSSSGGIFNIENTNRK